MYNNIASYIEGINTVDQEKKYSVSLPNIPYQKMTDGELSIALLERQYRLFSKAYPELEKKADYLRGVLNHSLSGIEATIRTDRQLENWTKRKLKDNIPAIAGYYKTGIGQFESYEDYRQVEYQKCQEIKTRWDNTPWIRFSERNRLRKEWEYCFQSVQYVAMVNEKFEENAPHLLYHFSRGATTGAIATKKVLHNVALENYSAITGLSRANLSIWLRNGVIAQNLKAGAGSKNPENTIGYMMENVRSTQIGNPAILIPIIIGIFKAALAAAVVIMQRLNERDKLKMLANTQGFETESFGPQKDDFLGIEGGQISPLLILAAFAFIK